MKCCTLDSIIVGEQQSSNTKTLQSQQFQTPWWLYFLRLLCHFPSVDPGFHPRRRGRNLRWIAGKGIIDQSFRHPGVVALGLKLVALSSADLVRREELP